MTSSVRYPIGIQTFEKLREEDFLYVDKTELVYKLVKGGQYFFLSRPRRFGKSLLLSTIKAYFEGRKDLFEGLAMQRLEKDWIKYPVLMLSLAAYNPGDEESLQSILDEQFKEFEAKYGVTDIPLNLSMRFRRIIRHTMEMTGRKVVVLVDEYDAPVVAHIGDDRKMEKMRNLLKSVYTNIKDMDAYIHFGFLTGVSRFSKMTIFSGLNNVEDISLNDDFSAICGVTEEELRSDFKEGISALATKLGTDYDGALLRLKDNYDGYHFTEECPDIYNPFSLLNALKSRKISSYWFQYGTPTFLVRLLGKEKVPLSRLFSENVPEAAISDIDTYRSSPLALLFQTGYLTIKEYDTRRQRYRLGIPNREVETGLLTELLAYTTDTDKYAVQIKMMDIRYAFEDGEPEKALSLIKSFFASIPAIVTQQDKELYYENNLYMLLRLVGIDAHAELWNSDGRIDMLVQTPDYVYVMELKLDSTPEAALAQIDSKDYTLQWKHDGRRIIRIGINYSSASRNLDSWIIEGEICENGMIFPKGSV